MYTWRIDVLLKSGKQISSKIQSEQNNSYDAGCPLFENKTLNDIIVIDSIDNNSQYFIMVGEIAAMRVTTWNEEIFTFM